MSDYHTYSDAQIEALKAAIAQGARTVSYGDRSITYHSLEEMQRLLNAMIASRDKSRVTRITATFSKGL